MLFRKKTDRPEKKFPFPGTPCLLDGYSAVAHTEAALSDAIALQQTAYPQPAHAGFSQVKAQHNHACTWREAASAEELAGLAMGFAASGLRASALISGDGIAGLHATLSRTATRHLPFVLHLATGSPMRVGQGAGCHDAFHTVSNAGLFQLFASTVQEVIDFTLIAHKLAELVLSPGLVGFDSATTGVRTTPCCFPDKNLIQQFSGRPADIIDSPTQAQGLLFGQKRRRVPEWLNLDQPAGIGIPPDAAGGFKALAARHIYFTSHIPELITSIFREFGDLTGRYYAPITGHRVDDATHIVVAQGALAGALCRSADFLRASGRCKAGVLNLSVFQPFPAATLAHFLKGRKGVTILESVEQHNSGNLPIAGEVRAALDRSLENGLSTAAEIPFPDFPALRHPEERPAVFSGIYAGVDSRSIEGTLCAAFENMLADGAQKRFYYLGLKLSEPGIRIPKLETLQQTLRQDYPNPDIFSLHASEDVDARFSSPPTLIMRASRGQNIGTPMCCLAGTLRELGWLLETGPEAQPGASASWHGFNMHVVRGAEGKRHFPTTDVFILIGQSLHCDPASLPPICSGASVFVLVDKELRASDVPLPFQKWCSRNDAKLYCLLAPVDQLSPSIYQYVTPFFATAAFACSELDLELGEVEQFITLYISEYQHRLAPGKSLIKAVQHALEAGTRAEKIEIVLQDQRGKQPLPAPEPEAPWPLQDLKRMEDTVFSPGRFWDSVGFLYKSHREKELLADPFLATGVVPARSSSFRDFGLHRQTVPQIIPEMCTGCSLCWAQCPDSALPATIQTLPSIVGAALERCENEGRAVLQLKRIADHLIKQAYKLVLRKELDPYTDLGELVGDAFEKVMTLLKPDEDRLAAFRQEFHHLRSAIHGFPIIRTDVFFDASHEKQAGTGMLLSINVDPQSCKACGLCAAVCPENAIELVPQTTNLLQHYRENWQFALGLPEVSVAQIEPFVCREDPRTSLNFLLNKRAFFTMIGGDAGSPGSGVRMAVHLITAAIQVVMMPRITKAVALIDSLIKRIEEKMQHELDAATRINDFESFGRRLSAIDTQESASHDLARIMLEDVDDAPDQGKLQRLATLRTKLVQLRKDYIEGADGNGRANMAVAFGTSTLADSGAGTDALGACHIYPDNPYAFPWIFHHNREAGAISNGLFSGFSQKIAAGINLIRQAESEFSGNKSSNDNSTEIISWATLNEDERALCPVIAVVAEASDTHAAVFAGTTHASESDFPVKHILLNSQAVALQEHPPSEAETTTKEKRAISMMEPAMLAMAERRQFVLQSTIGQPGHLFNGVMRSIEFGGPAFLHIYTPEPHYGNVAPEETVKLAQLACESRLFPLLTFDPGKKGRWGESLDLTGNPAIDQDWMQYHLNCEAAAVARDDSVEFLLPAHWAFEELRFQTHFNLDSSPKMQDTLLHVSNFIKLGPADRQGVSAFIRLHGSELKGRRFIISREMVALIENRLEQWITLKALAGEDKSLQEKIQKEVDARVEKAVQNACDRLQDEHENELLHLREQHEAACHEKLTRKLLALSGYSGGKLSLRDALARMARGVDP